MVDKIYVLHHKGFVNRKEYIENKLNEEGVDFEFVEKYLPEEIDYEKELKDWHQFPMVDIVQPYGTYKNFSTKISIGSLSLVLKHLWCFKEQLKNNYENILILEDDANIPDNFKYYINNNMNDFKDLQKTEGVEMMMLGTSHHFKSKGYVEGKYAHYSINQKTRCTHAYVVNISVTKKLIDNFNIINLPIDFKLNEILQVENIKVAWSEPGITQKNF